MEEIQTFCPISNRFGTAYTKKPFEISSLGSDPLNRLFYEAASYAKGVRIEVVHHRRCHSNGEEHVAALLGVRMQDPTVQFVDSLNLIEQIEAIAHELLHVLLIYRYGLNVIDRRIPRRCDGQETFIYCLTSNRSYGYLLGQIVNTAHHLILVDYLKQEYGIESSLHLRLLNHNFKKIVGDHFTDRQSLYARALIAFEYERLIGQLDRVMDPFHQTVSFWKAYDSALKLFGKYSFQTIPAPLTYKENVLALLECLGYQKQDFIFSEQR